MYASGTNTALWINCDPDSVISGYGYSGCSGYDTWDPPLATCEGKKLIKT